MPCSRYRMQSVGNASMNSPMMASRPMMTRGHEPNSGVNGFSICFAPMHIDDIKYDNTTNYTAIIESPSSPPSVSKSGAI